MIASRTPVQSVLNIGAGAGNPAAAPEAHFTLAERSHLALAPVRSASIIPIRPTTCLHQRSKLLNGTVGMRSRAPDDPDQD